MAAPKTRPTKASVDIFIEKIADDTSRADCLTLLRMMQRITRAEPRMWGTSMVGFGSYKYKYASGHEGEWFLTGFSPRKRDLTLYIMSGFEPYEAVLKRLGKHKTSKSCLYIKRLADVDLAVLKELVTASVKRMKQLHG